MPSTTRRMPSCTLARVDSLTARIVPSICAVSGMTLLVVPAVIRPTVTTAGSNTSTRAGDHRLQRLHDLARDRDRIERPVRLAGVAARARDGDAQRVGRRHASGRPGSSSSPVGSADVMWMANALVTGDGVPSASGGTSSSPSSSMKRAPWCALLAGLEHEQHPAGQLVAVRRQQPAPRRPASPCGCRGRRRASRPSTREREVEAGVLVQRQGVHVAAQQDRRARLGRRSAARRSPLVVSWRVTSSGRPSSASSTWSRVIGRSLPISGQRCSVRRSSTVGRQQLPGLLAQVVGGDLGGGRHRVMVRDGSSRTPSRRCPFRAPSATPRRGSRPLPGTRRDRPCPNGIIGADVDQLHTLGDQLRSKPADIEALISTVTNALANTAWQGPARRPVRGRVALVVPPGAGPPDARRFDAAGNECVDERRPPPGHGHLRSPPGPGRASRVRADGSGRRGPVRPYAAAPCTSWSSPSSRSSRVDPGPHVTAAVDAARAAGVEVEFGPFGSTCRADSATMPDILAAITRAAFANGATHVSLHVAKVRAAGD